MIIEGLVFIIIFTICGSVICMRLIKNMKNETHKEQGRFLQKLIKINLTIQAVGWPVGLLFLLGLIILHQKYLWLVAKYEFIQHTLFGMQTLISYFRIYVGFHSLVIAFCRYCFIVHDSSVSNFGIQMFKRIVSSLNFAIPLVLALCLDAATDGKGTIYKIITDAYDQHAYSHENSTSMSSILPPTSTPALLPHQHPIRYFVRANVPAEFEYIIKILTSVMVVLAMSNVLEGGLYYLIFHHCQRYSTAKHCITLGYK